MATTSEIQVTEAYIGLLGRAPDPAGLAYWAAQLDAAIAAGEDAAVALKKLTNDITLNDEWTESTTGSADPLTLAGATTVVTDMYQNLFGRDPSAADITYWTAELMDESTTASEMAVQLIQGAKGNTSSTADADTLALKQEAATYYVETVDQADFSRGTAQSSVSGVDSPQTLATSKAATDTLVSGIGITAALTTANNTVAMTNGDDTVTGTVGSGATFNVGDNITDGNTKDNDTLELSGDAGFTFGAVANVENINVSLAAREDTRFTINADNDAGVGTLNVTLAESVTIAGATLDGETRLTVNNLASNLTTTNATDVVVTLDPAASQTLTFDGDAASVDISSVDANDTTVTLANNDVTLAIGGTAATNDAMSITADNEVAITNGTDVELLTLAGSNNDVAFDISGVAAGSKMTYTVAGDNDVTLIGDADQFNGSAFANTGTADVTLDLDAPGAGNASIENFGVLGGGVILSGAAGDYAELNLASGNTVTITGAAANVHLDANDTATDSAVTVNANVSTAALDTDKFETVTISTNDSSAVDLGTMDFNGANSVTISGTNDITVNTIDDVNVLSISGEEVVLDGALGGTTKANDVTITAAGDADTVAMTTNNDITITAGDQSSVTGTVTVTAGDFALTAADKVDVDAISVAAGNITITATENDVAVGGAVDAEAGTVSLTAGTAVALASNNVTGNDVEVSAGTDISTTGGTITATNDVSLTSATGEGNDVNLAGSISVTSGDITISGDAIDISGAGTIASGEGNVVITAANEVTEISDNIDAEDGTLTITAGTALTALNADVTANAVTITAGTDLNTTGGIISSNNDVAFTTASGDGNDINLAGTINVAAGNVEITSGDQIDISGAGDIDVEVGNIVLTSGNEMVLDDAMDTASGGITVTAGTTLSLSEGAGEDSITATNDITITAGSTIDAGGIVKSTLGNISITANDIDTDKAIDAEAGSITLNMLLDNRAETSALNNLNAGDDITISNGQFTLGVVTATNDVIISGDTVITSATSVTSGGVLISSNNDVTFTVTDTSSVVSTGTNDVNLGTVQWTAGEGDDIDITMGSGNDTMILDDDEGDTVSVFTVNTGAGNDDVTITDDGIGATSVINLGAGDDTLDLNEDTDSVTIIMGAGDDEADAIVGFQGSIAFGTGDDELNLTAEDYSSSGVWTDVETLTLAGAVTLSEAQLDNDSTFELGGTAGTITVTDAVSVDVSGVTFGFGWGNGFDITAKATGGVITGSSNADTLTAGAAVDSFTGGLGGDTFEINSTEAAMDSILDYTDNSDILSLDDSGGDGSLAAGADIGTGEGPDVTSVVLDSNGEALSGEDKVDAIVTNGVLTLEVGAEGEAADLAEVDTLAEWIDIATIVLATYDEDTGEGETDINEYAIAFEFAGSTYVITSTDEMDVEGDSTIDDVVKLTGVTNVQAVNVDTNGVGDINIT